MKLTTEQIDQFQAHGVVIVPGTLTDADLAPVIAAIESWIDDRANAWLAEGRITDAHAGEGFDTRIASLYAPSGSSGDHRQDSKVRYLVHFIDVLQAKAAAPGEYLVCGDWNIAHKEIDLKNWKNNKKNSGFLPHERAWMDRLFDEIGLVDVFRRVNPNEDQFTWWSQRGAAWDNNVGWRIDYHVATPGLAATATAEHVYRETRLSDHAPLTIDYDLEF